MTKHAAGETETRVSGLIEDLRLAGSLDDRIRRAAHAVSGRIAFSTSLGMEDQAVLDAIASTSTPIDVFTLDTGRHFPETIETIEQSELAYRLKIRVVAPAATDLEALVARHGVLGFRSSIEAREACCHVRKVLPLRRALNGASAWITGLRREQSSGRSDVPLAAWDNDYGLIKINPIADWSLDELESYLRDRRVPLNPLHAQGFPSIGCQPCTRAVKPGEDIRAGRWWWEQEDGKECGLHARPLTGEQPT